MHAVPQAINENCFPSLPDFNLDDFDLVKVLITYITFLCYSHFTYKISNYRFTFYRRTREFWLKRCVGIGKKGGGRVDITFSINLFPYMLCSSTCFVHADVCPHLSKISLTHMYDCTRPLSFELRKWKNHGGVD